MKPNVYVAIRSYWRVVDCDVASESVKPRASDDRKWSMSTSITPLPGSLPDPLYPDSDGEPMGETDLHVAAILHLYDALRRHFRRREDVHVAADLFLYYEEGNPSACKAPDVMVTKGVQGNHPRRFFRTWEEQVSPTVIIEVTSDKTRAEDEKVKPELYARIGVREYFIFDPELEVRRERLRGFRLKRGQVSRLAPEAQGQVTSRELELVLEPEGHLLRLFDPATGRRILTGEEQEDEVVAQRERADAEHRRAQEQQLENDRLRREIELLKRDSSGK
ncbi:MAG TPA: Uma2 family endonuclease [Pirellulales bacterium]|nr:Uma2 family endonuclease [Pirellulales bacterium]